MTSAPPAALAVHPATPGAAARPALPDLRALPAEAGAGAWAVGTDSFIQPRRAAFWLLALFISLRATVRAQAKHRQDAAQNRASA